MKRINIYAAATISFIWILLSGCGDRHTEPRGREEVQLDISIGDGPETKVDKDGTTPEDGDRFKFFFNLDRPDYSDVVSEGSGDSDVKRTYYTYSGTGTRWTASSPIFWDNYKPEERKFCAIMLPESAPVSVTDELGRYRMSGGIHSFSVAIDQNGDSGKGYFESDLMMARIRTNLRLIPVNFQHIMSRARVVVTTPAGEFPKEDIKSMEVLLNGIRVESELDYTTDAEEAIQGGKVFYNHNIGVTLNGAGENIKMYSHTPLKYADGAFSATYVAIIPPQEISRGTLFLTITIKSEGATSADSDDVVKNYYYSISSDEDVVFEQGMNTTVSIKLKKTEVELAGIPVEAISVGGWNDVLIDDSDNVIGIN